MLVEGAISLKACIQNKKRTVNRVYIDKTKRTKDFNYIRRLIKENNIELLEINRDDFLNYTSGKTHGGIIGEVSGRINDVFDEGDIFFLDGIEDPFNIGYIIRTLYAFGIKNIMLPLRDYSTMEAQIIKSSAGAYESANIKLCEDPLKEVLELKKKGYKSYALKRGDDAKDMFDEKFAEKAIFLLGGEKRGISKGLMENCDQFLYIPYASDFRNSLNAAAAADVLATLLYKQKRHD